MHEPYFQAIEPMAWGDNYSYVPTPKGVACPEAAAVIRTSLHCDAEGAAPIAKV